MKIVLTRNIEYDFDSVFAFDGDGSLNLPDGYIVTSEPADVEFTMINVDLTSAKVDVIDKKIEKAESGIYLLKQAKAELLAIPDMSVK